MSAPLLAQALAGNVFFAFISSIAFATILAVVAGLTISATTSFAHDFWTNVEPFTEVRNVRRVRISPASLAFLHLSWVPSRSALPSCFIRLHQCGISGGPGVCCRPPRPTCRSSLLSIFWRRFNTTGAVLGLAAGLIASIGLILVGPSLMGIDPPTVTGAARHLIQAKPIFPLENPGISQYSFHRFPGCNYPGPF